MVEGSKQDSCVCSVIRLVKALEFWHGSAAPLSSHLRLGCLASIRAASFNSAHSRSPGNFAVEWCQQRELGVLAFVDEASG
jgi:hypothetical protein